MLRVIDGFYVPEHLLRVLQRVYAGDDEMVLLVAHRVVLPACMGGIESRILENDNRKVQKL